MPPGSRWRDGHLAGCDGQAGREHDDAARDLQDPPEPPEPPRTGHRCRQVEGRQQERHAEAQRIGGQQPDPGAGCQRRGRQHAGQHRPDAGRPAEAEGDADQRGGDRAAALARRPEAQVAHQRRHAQQAHLHEPHRRDEQAGDDGELVGPAPQQPADRGRAEAQQHEHQPEAQHEEDGQAQRPPTLGARRGEVGPRHPGDVARHQRQHAGRQERHQPPAEGENHAEQGEVDRHARRLPASAIPASAATPIATGRSPKRA